MCCTSAKNVGEKNDVCTQVIKWKLPYTVECFFTRIPECGELDLDLLALVPCPSTPYIYVLLYANTFRCTLDLVP